MKGCDYENDYYFSQQTAHTQTDGGLSVEAVQVSLLVLGAGWALGSKDQPSSGEQSGIVISMVSVHLTSG